MFVFNVALKLCGETMVLAVQSYIGLTILTVMNKKKQEEQ